MASLGQAAVFASPPESPRKRAFLLGLKVAGAACWTCAYHEAIREARKTGRGLLPEPAIACNLAWEAIYSSGGIWKWHDLDIEDKVQTVINTVWLFYDIRFMKSLGDRERQNSKLMLAAAVLYQLFFLAKYPPGKAARISALWQNLAFSGYSALVPTPKFDTDKTATKFTILRAIGTAIPTLTSGVLRGVEPAYLIPGLGSVGFDLIRIGRQGAFAKTNTSFRRGHVPRDGV